MKVFVLLSFSIVSTSLLASNIFEVRVEKVDTLGGHSVDFEWEFTSEYGTTLKMICPIKKYKYYDKPHILYFGNENQYITRFTIDKNINCDELNEYLRAVSYRIDPISPINIKFNKKEKKVNSIIFPNVDPYELGFKVSPRIL